MTGKTGLAADYATRTDFRGACDTDLRGHHRVMTDLDIVGNLDEVVELHAMVHICATHSSPVNRSIRAQLDIVAEFGNAYLLNLVVNAVGIGSEPESVGPEDHPAVEHATRADLTSGINFRSGVDNSIVTYGASVAYIGLRVNLDIAAELHILSDVCESTHIDAFREVHAVSHEGWFLNAFGNRPHGLCRHIEKRCETGVRVIDANESGLNISLGYEVLAHKDNRGIGGIYEMRVFGIGEEGQVAVTGFFDFRERTDLDPTTKTRDAAT